MIDRKSQWFGVVTNETPDVWTHDGDALAGFCGTVGGDSVLGLMVSDAFHLSDDSMSYFNT